MAHKIHSLLLTAQRALKREKYGLTRLLASCSQLRERSKEKNMGSQGSWPLAHSSESAQEREIWAHKALSLLLTAQRGLKREKYGFTRLLASCSQLRESESAQEREIWAHKALGLLLTAQRALKREIGSQGF